MNKKWKREICYRNNNNKKEGRFSCYLYITHLFFALSMVNHFALIQFDANECEPGYSTGVSPSNTHNHKGQTSSVKTKTETYNHAREKNI